MNKIRLICTGCGRDFKCETSGVLVREWFQKNKEVYRVWAADLLRCPGCGISVVGRFADNPIAEHWDKEKMADALLQCEKKTLSELFEWKEYVNKGGMENATQGKPEDA